MPKVTSVTGVIHLTVNFSEEAAQVSEERAQMLARVLKKASSLDPALHQLVMDFIDYVSMKES